MAAGSEDHLVLRMTDVITTDPFLQPCVRVGHESATTPGTTHLYGFYEAIAIAETSTGTMKRSCAKWGVAKGGGFFFG